MVRNKKVTFALNVGVVLFFITDITLDLLGGEFGPEFVLELAVFGMASALLFHEMGSYYRVRDQYHVALDKNTRLSGELHNYINESFVKWGLTSSEQEISWLLLKGYSFQEIGQARNTKEKTVRQQATSIYAKSGSSNRGEFAALFIEDLLHSSHLENEKKEVA